jgi:hypothetical protein
VKVAAGVLSGLFIFVESNNQVNVAPLLLPALVGTFATILFSAVLYRYAENRSGKAGGGGGVSRSRSSQWL